MGQVEVWAFERENLDPGNNPIEVSRQAVGKTLSYRMECQNQLLF